MPPRRRDPARPSRCLAASRALQVLFTLFALLSFFTQAAVACSRRARAAQARAQRQRFVFLSACRYRWRAGAGSVLPRFFLSFRTCRVHEDTREGREAGERTYHAVVAAHTDADNSRTLCGDIVHNTSCFIPARHGLPHGMSTASDTRQTPRRRPATASASRSLPPLSSTSPCHAATVAHRHQRADHHINHSASLASFTMPRPDIYISIAIQVRRFSQSFSAARKGVGGSGRWRQQPVGGGEVVRQAAEEASSGGAAAAGKGRRPAATVNSGVAHGGQRAARGNAAFVKQVIALLARLSQAAKCRPPRGR